MNTILHPDGTKFTYFTARYAFGRNRKPRGVQVQARLLVKVNWYRVASVGGKFELWAQKSYEAGTTVWLSGYNTNGQVSVVLPNGNGIQVSKAEVEVVEWPSDLVEQSVAEYEALATIPAQVVEGECEHFASMRKLPTYQASQAERF